ncbi:hypothetical protein QYH60_13215 (plasmid) [Lactococcus lactis subsp. lactis]|uniref:hypothetical protein n=1 Tax=Lactococcus lactis TaxID=1358 RepID=UPI002648E636|nr:hypothetical protein [Lactococcus lactis]WKB49908.1 hypothetical protein QYH60_13215 [Lactococcus lactis subsp. lactis]
MNLFLLSIVWLEVIVLILVVGGGVLLILILKRFKKELVLYKKRIRIIQDFKEIYDSYCRYRVDIFEDTSDLLEHNRVGELACNKFWGDEELFKNINCQDDYHIFQSKLCRLETLSEDFNILYEGTEGELIQSFIFWYHTLILQIGFYQNRLAEGNINYARHEPSLKAKITQLEKIYKKIDENFLIEQFENLSV